MFRNNKEEVKKEVKEEAKEEVKKVIGRKVKFPPLPNGLSSNRPH